MNFVSVNENTYVKIIPNKNNTLLYSFLSLNIILKNIKKKTCVKCSSLKYNFPGMAIKEG